MPKNWYIKPIMALVQCFFWESFENQQEKNNKHPNDTNGLLGNDEHKLPATLRGKKIEVATFKQ
jgi:hypothetical protein